MYDILCTVDDKAHTLSHQTTVFKIAHPLQAGQQPLYRTSHPLDLCHHTVCTDISPTFVWHHIHLLWDIIWTLYNNTPIPYVITLLYLWHHSLYIWNHIQYEGNIYTIHETSQPQSVSSQPQYRQHLIHALYNITLAISVASFALYKTSHPHFMISNHRVFLITPTIFYIMSTVSVSWHPVYWWYHTKCISEITSSIIHDIISIVYEMTATGSVS